MSEYATAVGLVGVLAVAGVPPPIFALVVAVIAFAVAMVALVRVNRLVPMVQAQADAQADEISRLAGGPATEGGDGDD